MTLFEARKRLKPPLIFGNQFQIEAVNFISRIHTCLDAIHNCPHGNDCEECHGTGEMECEKCFGEGVCSECDRDCLECGGSGRMECEECGGKKVECACLKPFTDDELNQAHKALRDPFWKGKTA